MAALSLPREATLRKVAHPEYLRGPDATRVLIDDPLADRIAKGDATFGWEGDDRFALYVNHRAGRWELWRFENDNVYRLSVCVPGFVGGVDVVPWCIQWIVEHDGRRGFDALESVLAANEAVERDKARRADDQFEEAADRLHHALTQDVGHLEVGMSRRQF